MSRNALVVGINTYTDQRLNGLESPSEDAEAIAQTLEKYGDFKVTRLPAVIDTQNTIRVGRKTKVTLAELEKAIINLFKLKSSYDIPDTALLYFSGHGLRKDIGFQEGFLATSDVKPDLGYWGLSLQWLRRLLQESEVRQQIIWLDSCYSGEVLNFNEADPGNRGNGRDRCFIAASSEVAYAYGQTHGVLTSALLNGLTSRAERWVTNYTLIESISQERHKFPQSPTFTNSGGTINLTHRHDTPDSTKDDTERLPTCPYKGLAYFDNNEKDPKYFYGRTELTDQLLDKVREGNFLAVLGASGSGKSSVVRAGLLYQLKQGHRLSGSDTWRIRIFRPGEHPLQSLAVAFLNPDLSVVERAAELPEAQALIEEGMVGLEQLINADKTERVVLVVDQFEEAFTLCKDSIERQQLFECLLGALERIGNKLCLVLVMRADFLGKCAEQEYAGLAQKIQEHLVTVTPMKPEELEQAITEPAKQVGLEVEPALVNKMIADVDGSPGSLPLLQYTLTEIFQHRTEKKLTLSAYRELGGVKGTLQKRANEVYKSLSEEEQQAAKQIFLQLTHLGQGTEDTRKRVRQRDLVTSSQSRALVDQIIQKLADAKLVVTSTLIENGSNPESVAVVDIVHEALIRHWSLLRSWLDEDQDALRQQQYLQENAIEWQENGKPDNSDFLLQGAKLAMAESYCGTLPLSELTQEFIQVSKAAQERFLKEKEKQIADLKQALVESEKSQIKALIRSSETLFALNQTFDSLIEALRAGTKLQKADWAKDNIQIRDLVVTALQEAVYWVRECNRLERHDDQIGDVSFSPDGQTIASASDDYTVKLWQLDGTLIDTPKGHIGHSAEVINVSFSPDGKILASASADKTVKLWQLDGNLLNTLTGHEDLVYGVSFSPDGKILASASADKTVKLWQVKDGSLLNTLTRHEDRVYGVSFSPDGEILASASADKTVKLWRFHDGELLIILEGHNHGVNCGIFSPDGQTIASASQGGTVKLWKLDGTLLQTLKGHSAGVTSVSFSPDGQTIASASDDKTIRLWELDGTLLKTFKGHIDSVQKVSVSSDGKTLASSSNDKTVKLWKLNNTWLKAIRTRHENQVYDVSFSANGRMFASASADKTVELWQIDGALLKKLQGHQGEVYNVSFSPDGKMLASASADKTVKLWRLDGTLLKTIRTPEGNSGKVYSVSFSPDSQTIASAYEDKTVKLWRLDGTLLTTLQGHTDKVFGVSYSPDGKMLVSASRDKTVKLWKWDGTLLTTFNGHNAEVRNVSFSPDSQMLASVSSDQKVKLWKQDGTLIATLEGHSAPVIHASFSPDGEILASASRDQTVKLWKQDGTLLTTLRGHRDEVRSVRFLDNQTLASASLDQTIIQWSLFDLGEPLLNDLLVRGCDWVHNYLKSNPNVSEEDRRLLCDELSRI